MHHHLAGCPAGARLDSKVKDFAWRHWDKLSDGRWCSTRTGRRTLSQQHLQVSCTAVEQDTEAPSTSGRSHTDSDLLHVLFQAEQPTVMQPPLDSKQLNLRIKAAGSLALLCDLIRQQAPVFDHRTTSHALYRLSLMCHAYFTQLNSAHLTSREAQQAAWLEYVEPALQMLGQLLLRHMDVCDPWGVCISLWAYGNLQCSDEAVLAGLCERGLQVMQGFTPRDCASALGGIAKLRIRPKCLREFVDHVLSHCLELLSNVEAWSTQEVTNVLWALSKIGAAGTSRRTLLEGLIEMTLWRLPEFKVQELAVVVYSCGRLRLRLPLQLVKITNHIAARLPELSPLDAAHVMWGCAKLDFKPDESLLEHLPHAMAHRLGEFKPQEVCNLLYGYGHLQHEHPVLLEGMATACTPRLHEFSTQDLCVTIWSYGMLRYCPADTTLFDTACKVLLQRSNRLLPMQLTMIAKGFAKTGYQPPAEFMRQVAQLSIMKLHQFSPLEYSQLLWAYAQLGYRDVQLFEAVVGQTIHNLQTWTRRLPKTTVDTIMYACQRVGLWPQMLLETAEMRGVFVKTNRTLDTAQMQPLLPQGISFAAAAAAGGSGGDSSTSSSCDGAAIKAAAEQPSSNVAAALQHAAFPEVGLQASSSSSDDISNVQNHSIGSSMSHSSSNSGIVNSAKAPLVSQELDLQGLQQIVQHPLANGHQNGATASLQRPLQNLPHWQEQEHWQQHAGLQQHQHHVQVQHSSTWQPIGIVVQGQQRRHFSQQQSQWLQPSQQRLSPLQLLRPPSRWAPQQHQCLPVVTAVVPVSGHQVHVSGSNNSSSAIPTTGSSRSSSAYATVPVS
eukprot:GHRR01006863.1.p1 GENE.GHRR01006863.1~~GHRR01006863.1.p1  ORF type:complete len:835 (+),score=329.03 GHRR01006863.1:732-3236(+)